MEELIRNFSSNANGKASIGSGTSLFDSNLTDEFLKSLCDPKDETPISVDVMVFSVLVCVFGIIGNFLVFFVILTLKEYKKAATHWYVLQLAIADTVFLLTLPFKMLEDTNGEWIFGRVMCKVKETVLFMNYFSSILFLMVMSMDRYLAVCHGLSANLQRFRTKRFAHITTLIVWSVSLVLCVPIILYSDKVGFEPHCLCMYEFPVEDANAEEECRNEALDFMNESLQDCIGRKESQNKEFCRKLECTEMTTSLKSMQFSDRSQFFSGMNISNQTNMNNHITEIHQSFEPGCSYAQTSQGFSSYLIFNFVVMFIIPLIVLTTCYSLIAMKLRQTNIRRRTNAMELSSSTTEDKNNRKVGRKRLSSSSLSRAQKNRIRVTFLCFIMVLLFIICWLPFHAVHLAKINGISGTAEFCSKLAKVCTIIAYLNSALNPYAYSFTGTRVGKRLRTAAQSLKKRNSFVSSGSGRTRHVRKKQISWGTSSTGAVPLTKRHDGESDLTKK